MKFPKIYINIPPLFSFQECLWFLDRNYDDCLHDIQENSLIKAVQIDSHIFLIRITEIKQQLEIEILMGENDIQHRDTIKDYVEKWFDMQTNIKPFYELLHKKTAVAYMTERYAGLRLIGIENLFEAICWSIIGQQIHLRFAYKLKRRFVEKYGTFVALQSKLHYIFPDPLVISQLLPPDLQELQFSLSKATYIINIAKACIKKELSFTAIQTLSPTEQIHTLCSYKGIGIWTAHYVLMKCFRYPNAIPYGDIGLFNALQNHNIIQTRKEKIDIFFDHFDGWKSYAVFYLWRSLYEL